MLRPLGVVVAGRIGVHRHLAFLPVDQQVDGDTRAGVAVDLLLTVNVKLQVVPFLAGSHPGMTSAFSIVSFAEPGAMDVVYMDTTASTLWLESEADAVRHTTTFERIARNGLALRDSVALIERIRKEL